MFRLRNRPFEACHPERTRRGSPEFIFAALRMNRTIYEIRYKFLRPAISAQGELGNRSVACCQPTIHLALHILEEAPIGPCLCMLPLSGPSILPRFTILENGHMILNNFSPRNRASINFTISQMKITTSSENSRQGTKG